MLPKSASLPLDADEMAKVRKLLDTYIQFLSVAGNLENATSLVKTPSEDHIAGNMAAIFDPANPASPLAYGASKTALLLMDFQGFTVNLAGIAGMKALGKAKTMRDWAFSKNIIVVHSVVDITVKPPATFKGAERIVKMLESIKDDKDAVEEPSEIAFSKADGEYIVLKHPGFANALKSTGIMELLTEHGIKSLILCGIATSGCVLKTAFPATDDGWVVSVIEDACADRKEEMHNMLAHDVLVSRAHVATADEFIEEWEKHVRK